jgi:hypothetical protein
LKENINQRSHLFQELKIDENLEDL